MKDASAYYLWPAVWVGTAPPSSQGFLELQTLGDEVHREKTTTGIEIRVLREGLFAFDFSEFEPCKGIPESAPFDFDRVALVLLNRVAVMNAHLACLYTSLGRLQRQTQEKMVLSPADLISMDSIDEENMSFGDQRIADLATSRFERTYSQGVPHLADWRIRSRTLTIEVSTAAESIERLDAILRRGLDAARLTDLYLRSCKSFEEHNYALSLVQAWTICERMVGELWTRYLVTNREREEGGQRVPFVDGARRRRLTDRDFTASVITEVLSLVGEISVERYRQLTEARRTRNSWIHGLAPITRQGAQSAVSTTEMMIRDVERIDVEVGPITRLHQ